MRTFTLYGLREPGGEIRYIGKTPRELETRRREHLRSTRSAHKDAWIAKLKSGGYEPEIIPLCINLTPEEANELEIFVISGLRKLGIDLVNMTLGGDGASIGNKNALGFKQSPETIAKKVAKVKGRSRPGFSKLRMGHSVSLETRNKIGNANRGKKHSEESRKNMSVAHIGKATGSDNPFFGKKHSTESRDRNSRSKKLWWDRKRQEDFLAVMWS